MYFQFDSYLISVPAQPPLADLDSLRTKGQTSFNINPLNPSPPHTPPGPPLDELDSIFTKKNKPVNNINPLKPFKMYANSACQYMCLYLFVQSI